MRTPAAGKCPDEPDTRGNVGVIQEAGIGIVRKIPLAKHSEPQKLIIMRLQMREIATQAEAGLHGIRRFERWRKCGMSPEPQIKVGKSGPGGKLA